MTLVLDALGRLRRPTLLVVALAAPIILVVGAIAAQAVQPPGEYDPIGQTISTLAGRGATDRWIMTATLALIGVLYVVVAAGLRGIRPLARGILAGGAAAVTVAALAAQPAHGSSTVHMTFTVIGAVAFAVWPIPLITDRTLAPMLRRGSLLAVLAMLGLIAWLCAQAWTDGTWIGVAERTLILGETVWPIVVVGWALRSPRWSTAALAVLTPVVFVVGLLFAQSVQPGTDAIDQSLSALSGLAATGRWIMASTLALVGLLTVLVAHGLQPRVPPMASRVLAAGGILLVVAGLSPQPVGGYSMVHMVAGGFAWAAYTLWPLGIVFSSTMDRRLRVASAVTVVVLSVLVAWFTVQLVTTGTWYGLSQRIVVLAQAVWPVVVAATASAREDR